MCSRSRSALAAMAISLAVALAGVADDWMYRPERTEKSFEFGRLRINSSIDARENQHHPEFVVEVKNGRKIIGLFPNVHFESLHPSPDHEYFLGLSNSGIPGTAFVLFDARGHLIWETKHNHEQFSYCRMSVSLTREWVAVEGQKVEFLIADAGYLQDVTVVHCSGSRISLSAAVQGAPTSEVNSLSKINHVH